MNSLANVRLLVTDVDGVLTDDTFTYGTDGEKYRRWNHADGQGVLRLREAGVGTVFLTQEESKDIERRAAALNVMCIIGGTDKLAALEYWLTVQRTAFGNRYPDTLAHVAYIGNELNDLPVLQAVGFPFVPANAWLEPDAGYQLTTNGGGGCLREVAERILAERAP